MYISQIKREELVSLLAGKLTISAKKAQCISEENLNFNNLDNCICLWKNKPSKNNYLPKSIVVDDDSIIEFLAFVSTYISTYKPFTSYFRVMTKTDAIDFLKIKETAGNANISSGLISVVIAEAYLQIGKPTIPLIEISTQACYATLSATIFKALGNNCNTYQILTIIEKWHNCKSIISDDNLRCPVGEIADFWKSVSDTVNLSNDDKRTEEVLSNHRDERIVFFLQKCFEKKSPPSKAWQTLVDQLPDLNDTLEKMSSGTREEQVNELEHVALILNNSEHINYKIRSLIAGFLTSKIAKGSMEYIRLCYKTFPKLLTSSLWFALFISLEDKNDIMTIGECLGRKLEKNLTLGEEWSDLVKADISAQEFLVLSSQDSSPTKIRTEHSSHFLIELHPTVTGSFSKKSSNKVAQLSQPLTKPFHSNEIRDMKHHIQKIERILNKLEPKNQKDFFDN